ncbi:MAG: HflC protein [Myxococcales bacterium]|nr:HflC protein [Myxococcales bacterium]
MSGGKAAGVIVLLVGLFLGMNAIYTVSEVDQVVVTRFGAPVGKPEVNPGLKFKVPFVDVVNRFDKRFLPWDGDANQMVTADKKYIWVDTFARWRVADPLLFFQKVRNENGAQTRLDDLIDGATRTVVASQPLLAVVRSTALTDEELAAEAENIEQPQQEKPKAAPDQAEEPASEDAEAEPKPEDEGAKKEDAKADPVKSMQESVRGRNAIQERIRSLAAPALVEMGIELIDVRIKRINYVNSVQVKVFERMISERKRIASQYRSEGQGEAAKIRGQMEQELKEIESESYRQAKEIRGNADAEATDIYAEAYKRDPEFYRFLKTLETYERSFDGNTRFVLDTKGEFTRYLNP